MTHETSPASNDDASAPGILDGYLTRGQLANELGVTVRTLNKWAWLRTGPSAIKVGARVYYHRDDVVAYLNKQRETSRRGRAAA